MNWIRLMLYAAVHKKKVVLFFAIFDAFRPLKPSILETWRKSNIDRITVCFGREKKALGFCAW